MNLDLTEDQEMLKNAARSFLTDKMPKTKVREIEESACGFDKELWRGMAELGWFGIILPERYGGFEGSLTDLAILLIEAGRNLLPLPLFPTLVLGELPILKYGSEALKERVLKPTAEGKLILGMAYQEGPYAPAAESDIQALAREVDGGFVLTGEKLYVLFGQQANLLLVPAKVGKQTSMLAVEVSSVGVVTEPIPTASIERFSRVTFNESYVPMENLLGEIGQGFEILQDTLMHAALLKSAELVGHMEAALEMTNEYAKTRVVYGRDLADFQVIQHYLVNMWLMLETSRNVLFMAVSSLSRNERSPLEPHCAAAWIKEAAKLVTERAIQIHGAIGITREHDAGLYYRQAFGLEPLFGSVRDHRAKIADMLVPGSV